VQQAGKNRVRYRYERFTAMTREDMEEASNSSFRYAERSAHRDLLWRFEKKFVTSNDKPPVPYRYIIEASIDVS
jgi:hypothetical protein